MTEKTETGDWCEMMSRVLNNDFWNPASFFPSQKILKFKFSNDFPWKSQLGSEKRLCNKRTSCRTLFRKIEIASDRIDEMKWTKEQIWSTLNFLTYRTNKKMLQSRFPGPSWVFQRKSLKILNFQIFCEGKKLAGLQKSFGTSDIIPHLSPVSVFFVIFVKLKIASREPSRNADSLPKISSEKRLGVDH